MRRAKSDRRCYEGGSPNSPEQLPFLQQSLIMIYYDIDNTAGGPLLVPGLELSWCPTIENLYPRLLYREWNV